MGTVDRSCRVHQRPEAENRAASVQPLSRRQSRCDKPQCGGRRERVGQSKSELATNSALHRRLAFGSHENPTGLRRMAKSWELRKDVFLPPLSRLPDRQPRSEAPVRHPALTVLSIVPDGSRAATTSWPSPLRALLSAWPRALLSSLPQKISQRRPWPVLPSSQLASPRPLQPASWPVPPSLRVQPWPVLPLPWQVLLSSRPVLPRPWRPAFWPALLLP